MKIFNLKLLAFFSLFVTSLFSAQENFKDETLALMENIAMKSEYKNVVEFLQKSDYEKVSESNEDNELSYFFMGPEGEMMKIVYSKSKKMKHIAMIIASDFPVLISLQTSLIQHGFKNLNYDRFRYEKSSYPFKFLTSESDNGNANVYLLTKNSEMYTK